jgi:hypothetical protein
VTLRSGWRSAALALVFSLAVVGLGVWLGTTGRGAGWAIVLLFGLGALASGAALLYRGSLTLTADGVTVRALGRSTAYRWSQITAVSASRLKTRAFASTSTIMLDLRDGRQVALPDSYGRRTDSLVSLLEDWRTKHAAAELPRS